MIVICGATGKIGGTAARALRSRGLPVTAVVRDVAKASALEAAGCTLATADLGDERAVTAAFRGADAVLVICPLRPAAGDVEGEAGRIIDALGAALASTRPQHVVAISDYGAHVPAGTGITPGSSTSSPAEKCDAARRSSSKPWATLPRLDEYGSDGTTSLRPLGQASSADSPFPSLDTSPSSASDPVQIPGPVPICSLLQMCRVFAFLGKGSGRPF
jgi:uncharacterized protein YbjT (DUF2867 family)